jgi:hypothetical protein
VLVLAIAHPSACTRILAWQAPMSRGRALTTA